MTHGTPSSLLIDTVFLFLSWTSIRRIVLDSDVIVLLIQWNNGIHFWWREDLLRNRGYYCQLTKEEARSQNMDSYPWTGRSRQASLFWNSHVGSRIKGEQRARSGDMPWWALRASEHKLATWSYFTVYYSLFISFILIFFPLSQYFSKHSPWVRLESFRSIPDILNQNLWD